MSAAASMQETLPLEGAGPCQLVVVYEDAAAHDLAMEVCTRVVARFEPELQFTFSFWQFKDLDNPASAHWVAEAMVRADIVLFSLQGHDLSPETIHWLDSGIPARTKASGALAVMVTERGGTDPVVEALLSRMESAARRWHMDFLPLLLAPRTPADPLPALLPETQMEPGSTHWGLNE